MIDNPLLERLRRELEAIPPGALLPRDWLLERLSENSAAASSAEGSAPLVDLSVPDLATLFGKRPSTVRAWLERGDFPGAYKLQGKEWRVPPSGVHAFQNQQRLETGDNRPRDAVPRLSDWRKSERSERGREAATNRSPNGNAEV